VRSLRIRAECDQPGFWLLFSHRPARLVRPTSIGRRDCDVRSPPAILHGAPTVGHYVPWAHWHRAGPAALAIGRGSWLIPSPDVRARLPNGITVLVLENHNSPSVVLSDTCGHLAGRYPAGGRPA
jgi:hypothetical protein